MKLKRWYLYLVAGICFALSFTALNRKYDRFYRVNGINNDNRALIERYLDEDEQDYLIEHAIAVSQFIDYIEYDEFHLQYYQYYNLLRQTQQYDDLLLLLTDANSMADRLTVEFGNGALDRFETLVKYNLEYAYLNSTYFDFNNIRYYQLLRTLYDENDYNYVVMTNTYITLMEEENLADRYDIFKAMVATYNSEGVHILMTTELAQGVKKLYEIDPMLQVVNDKTFIANYQPRHMTMIEGIPRLNYSMYLESEACAALKNMYNAMSKAMKQKIVLTQGYMDYDVLKLNDLESAGFSEFQLGNSISLKEQEMSESEFINTDTYRWLVEHSYEYGSVLRYPLDKVAITGKSSSTIFRYVGLETARKLHDNNWCLEEYKEEKTS